MKREGVIGWLTTTVTPSKEDVESCVLGKRKPPSPPPSEDPLRRSKRSKPSAADQGDMTPRSRERGLPYDGASDRDDHHDDASSQDSLSVPSSESSQFSRDASLRELHLIAASHPHGFLTKPLTAIAKPPSLDALILTLDEIGVGLDFLPLHLQDQLSETEHFPSCAFRTTNDPLSYQYPPHEEVRNIFQAAEQCASEADEASSWNLEVHSRILQHTYRNGPRKDRIIDYRYCLSAEIDEPYKPSYAPSKMVDFCIALRPATQMMPMVRSAIDARPTFSINHTDWGVLAERPIAISIETRREGQGDELAIIQLATWHAAQWRSILWENGFPANLRLEFLAGIVVVGHKWMFVATIRGPEKQTTTLESLEIGTTRSVFGIYKLLAAMQVLKRWAEEQFWPAFQHDVLGVGDDGEASGS